MSTASEVRPIALADGRRRAIFEILRNKPCTVAEIAATQIVVKKLFHAAPDQIRPNSLDQPIEKARA